MSVPTVSVVIPTYEEEQHIERTLEAIKRQTYPRVIEVIVVDGRSTDRTRCLAARHGAVVLDNPHRIQASALNIGIEAAVGDIIVRVDGHCTVEDDYVERCVDALERTGAAMVGGAMTPVELAGWPGAVAAAMSSPIGAGPARFHTGGEPGWVDTVYLGAYRRELALEVGGYATDVGVNEDGEFAIRMRREGGVWFDPAIVSRYVPRGTSASLIRQFWYYGRSRAATVRRHPSSIAARQLAAPALVVGLLSPWRAAVLRLYVVVVIVEGVRQIAISGFRGFRVLPVLPAMHLPWGAGFLVGLLAPRRSTLPRRLRRRERPPI